MIESLNNISSLIFRIKKINKKIEDFQNFKSNKTFSKFLEKSIARKQLMINNKLGKDDISFFNKKSIVKNNLGRTSLLNQLVDKHQSEKSYSQTLKKILKKDEKNSMKKKSTYNDYSNIIQKASQKYKVPQELIKAIIKQESNYNPISISKAGAKGLMQ